MSTGVLIETDVIVEYLLAPTGQTPLLRTLLQATTCYCTFLQAAEIYSAASNDEERRMVERPLFGLKVLGASSRYATTIGALLTSRLGSTALRTAIVAALASESKLPIVTDAFAPALAAVEGLRVIRASELRHADSVRAIVSILEGSTQ